MRKNGLRSKTQATGSPKIGQTQESENRITPPPDELHRVPESSLSAMLPGDILLLEDAQITGQGLAGIFYAVLACPFCGTPGLITPSQYFGAAPVMCGAKNCCGFFRVVGEHRLVYPPAN
jgi:hypothetical protein